MSMILSVRCPLAGQSDHQVEDGPGRTLHLAKLDSQLPSSEDYLYTDPDYPIEAFA